MPTSNQDAWASYVDYTKGVTESARALGFSSAAICWILKPDDGPPGGMLLLGLFLSATFFALDVIQYVVGAVRSKQWILAKEKELYSATGSLDGDYSRPRGHDAPVYALWVAKLIALTSAYVAIAVHVLSEWL